MLQSYRKLFEELKKKGPKRSYFLYGPEEYIKREFVSELIKTTLGEKNRAFNLDIFHGDDFDRDGFNDRVSSFPLFAERRVVIVKKFEALSTPNKDFVLDAVESLPESLVFVAESVVEKMDTARLKRLKKIAEAGGVSFRFQYLSESDTIERLRSRARRDGVTLEPDALALLVEAVGTQMIDLGNELEKIILAASPETVITREVVTRVVGKYRTENLFAFLDRLGRDTTGDLLLRMNRVIDGGEEPIFVMAMLLRRVLQLLQIKSLMLTGAGSPRAVASALGGYTSPYYVESLTRQADRMDLRSIHEHLVNLRWADTKLKTSSLPPRSILEVALLAASTGKTLAPYEETTRP